MGARVCQVVIEICLPLLRVDYLKLQGVDSVSAP